VQQIALGKKLSGRSLRRYVKNRTEFYLLRISRKSRK